jgi:hypothetical protein
MRQATHSGKGLIPPSNHKYFTGNSSVSVQDVTDSIPATMNCVITDIILTDNSNTGGLVAFKEETSGTVIMQVYLGGRETKIINLTQPIKLPTSGKKLQVLAGASNDIKVTCTYYLQLDSMEAFSSNY